MQYIYIYQVYRYTSDINSLAIYQSAVYTAYISGIYIYCLLGDYIIPTTHYQNQKNPLIRRVCLVFVCVFFRKKWRHNSPDNTGPLFFFRNRIDLKQICLKKSKKEKDIQVNYYPQCHPHIHPGRLTWNLQITYLERKMIFQTSMIMFHVNLQGCCLNGPKTSTAKR